MGKFLVGCLVVVLVLLIGGGTAGYFFIIKPGIEYARDYAGMAEEFQELNESIVNSEDYAPPAGTTVSEEQFQRFLAAQRRVRSQMENRLQELDEKYEAMKGEDRQEEMGVKEMAEAYKDLGGLLLEAKRVQVDALNQQDFSLDEYTWVRNRIYRAIGQSVAVATMGDQESASNQSMQVAEATVAMVEPHREELMENHVLAWFGL